MIGEEGMDISFHRKFKMKRYLLLAIPLFACTLSCAKAQNEKKDPPKLVISKEAQLIIDLTNKARVAAKLGALKPNALLFKCAEDHSANMAKQMKNAHELDGKNPADRVDATGYYYKTCGENLADHNVLDIKLIFDVWMKSPIHRKEILRAEYEEIGIGIVKNPKTGQIYFTQVFGTELKKE